MLIVINRECSILSHNRHASTDDVRVHHIEMIDSASFVDWEDGWTCRDFRENFSFDAS
jgi:hypothetical protein